MVTSSTFTKSSTLSCSAKCVSLDQGSYFGYNKDARHCSCGTSLVAGSVDASLKLYRHEDASSELAIARCPSSACSSAGYTCYDLTASSVCISKQAGPASFDVAKQHCETFGGSNGRLYVPDTIEKINQLVTVLFVANTNTNAWVGLDEIDNEGTWVWADGRVLTQADESFFGPGELSDSGDHDCGTAFCDIDDGALVYLKVEGCNSQRQYICEIPLD